MFFQRRRKKKKAREGRKRVAENVTLSQWEKKKLRDGVRKEKKCKGKGKKDEREKTITSHEARS